MSHFLPWHEIHSLAIHIVLFAGIVQGFFLALVLTTKKNKSRKSNRFLAILLIVLSLSILHSVIAVSSPSDPYVIKEPFVLLVGPLLLFYLRDCVGGPKLGLRSAVHVIPLLVFLAVPLSAWLAGSSSWSAAYLGEYSSVIGVGFWALIVIQYGFYWWKIVQLLNRHANTVQSEFASLEGMTLSWLRTFLHAFGILFLLLAGTVIFAVHSTHYAAVDATVAFGLSGIVFYLGYEGLFQEDVFSVLPVNVDPGDQSATQAPRAQPDMEQLGKLSEKLTGYFEEKKPYLDEGLTLTSLAAQLGITRNQLSAVINTTSGGNFYAFVNKYRVDEVRRLLADPGNKNLTLLSLAFQAGFPSKSSFHDNFKKFTGMTPSEFQRSRA